MRRDFDTIRNRTEAGGRKPRLETLDLLRGLTLVSMIAYHGLWDFFYLSRTGTSMTALRTWYEGAGGHLWQQSICRTFILLSGFCVPFSRHIFRRGLQVSAGGMAVSAVTILFLYEDRVLFGVLTFLGAAMLVTGAFGRLFKKDSFRDVFRIKRGMAFAGLTVCLLLFYLTRWINRGYLRTLPGVRLVLPASLYTFGSGRLPGYVLTGLGFTMKGFFSTDYFSFLPWIFLFWAGIFLHLLLSGEKMPENTGRTSASGIRQGREFSADRASGAEIQQGRELSEDRKEAGRKPENNRFFDSPVFHLQMPVLNLIGRHSLLIYLIHQPVLYLLTVLIF